jgi:hypothetical protein
MRVICVYIEAEYLHFRVRLYKSSKLIILKFKNIHLITFHVIQKKIIKVKFL